MNSTTLSRPRVKLDGPKPDRADDAQRWHQHFRDAPHKRLLKSNAFFDLLKSSQTVRLLHITSNFDAVLQQKKLFSSSGCLIGSIYCVPLFSTAQGLRVHNLGAYIFDHEVRRCLASRGANRSVEGLIVEIEIPTSIPRTLTGVNYLRLGDVHLRTYRQSAHLMPDSLRKELQNNVTRKILTAQPFLRMCREVMENEGSIDEEHFFKLLTQTIQAFPILGYLYFEAVTEYIMLFSVDDYSLYLHQKGELNCWGYKEFIFRIKPQLLQNFNLACFAPTPMEIHSTVAELCAEGRLRISADALISHTKRRLSFLVGECLAGLPSVPSFDALAQEAAPLLGHVIDREVRDVNRYGDFHFLFDSHKARQAWEYWRQSNCIIPFNGTLPKGEVGVNPTHSKLAYKIYQASPKRIAGDLYMEPKKELDVSIMSSLIHPSKAFMGIKPKGSIASE